MSPQLEFVLRDATALRGCASPQTRDLRDLQTMMATAGLRYHNGKQLTASGRWFARHVRSRGAKQSTSLARKRPSQSPTPMSTKGVSQLGAEDRA